MPQASLSRNSAATSPIACPSAPMTVRPRRFSSERRIAHPPLLRGGRRAVIALRCARCDVESDRGGLAVDASVRRAYVGTGPDLVDRRRSTVEIYRCRIAQVDEHVSL